MKLENDEKNRQNDVKLLYSIKDKLKDKFIKKEIEDFLDALCFEQGDGDY